VRAEPDTRGEVLLEREGAVAVATRSGVRVLTARGSQLESGYGFGAVRQLLEPVVWGPAPAPDSVFHGEARFAARVLSLTRKEPPPDMFSVLQALHRLTARLSDERPTLLVVDDAQWADEASLQYLAFVQHRLQDMPLAIVVATRPVPLEAAGALGQLVRAADQHLVLEPLSLAAAATLVRRVLPTASDSDCAAAHVATGGNPFYLSQLAREAQRRGTADLASWGRGEPLAADELREIVARRVTALGDDATALVRAVYVLGREARLRVVARLAALDVRQAEQTARDVVSNGVLSAGEVLEFVHPLVHDAVGALLVGELAPDLHLAAARVLTAAGADVERVAAQLVGTDPTGEPWVVDTLRDAAQQAASRGALTAALPYLRRALREPAAQRSAELLLELGTYEFLCADPAATDHLHLALDAARGDDQVARAALALARALTQGGDFRSALEVLARARARLDDTEGEAAVRLDMEVVTLGRLDLATTADADLVLSRYAARTGDHVVDKLISAQLCIEPVRRPGSRADAVALARHALAGGALLADQTAESHAMSFPVIALFSSDEYEQARTVLDDMITDAERRGSLVARTHALCWSAQVSLRAGDVPRAEAQAREALESVQAAGLVILAPFAVAFLSDALVERGALAEAAQLWPAAGLAGELPPVLPLNYVLFSRGALALALGQAESAAGDLLESGRRQQMWGVFNPAFWPWASQAGLALHQLGRVDEARKLIADELAVARRFGAPRAIGIALRAHGLVTAGPAGLSLLREAVAVLQPSPARLEHARASVDLGAALRRGGHRTEAREHLSLGLDVAVRCGATALAERARRELAAAGARPRRADAEGVDALTPSQRRVAELAAAGRTNRQIARELFISTKTVEAHVHAVLRTLQVESRTQLGGVEGLQEPPPGDPAGR
jgi:DNA-binding CsgD family transcriptional regulator/tetratricopeptide (TPR) repeat protein